MTRKSKRYMDKLLKRREVASKDLIEIAKIGFKGQVIWDLDYVSSSDEENPYYSRGGKESDDEDAVKELSKEDIQDVLIKQHQSILEREDQMIER